MELYSLSCCAFVHAVRDPTCEVAHTDRSDRPDDDCKAVPFPTFPAARRLPARKNVAIDPCDRAKHRCVDNRDSIVSSVSCFLSKT